MIKLEDVKAGFAVVCAIFGIGSLGIVNGFAMAGVYYAMFMLLVVFGMNMYATIVLTKCMERAPVEVKTYGDLGEHVAGRFGRVVVVFSQFATCFLCPIAFLVLGGTIILPSILEEIWPHGSPNVYMVVMAMFLLPFVLVKTIKEATWATILGISGTIIGDALAVWDSEMYSPHYEHVETSAKSLHVMSLFGSFAIAYGAGLLVPSLQREHSNGNHLRNTMILATSFVTIVYAGIGLIGNFQYGCVAPSNLLLSMSNGNLRRIAMTGFFIHISIAFAVLMNPMLFIIERSLFDNGEVDQEPKIDIAIHGYVKHQDTLLLKEQERSRVHKIIRRFILRTSIVAIQVFMAMLLQGSFNALLEFIGATTVTMSCIVLPLWFYLKMFHQEISRLEKIVCWCIIVTALTLAIISTAQSVNDLVHAIQSMKWFTSPKLEFANTRTLNLEYCQTPHLVNSF